MAKPRKPAEAVTGSYTAYPHAVLDSVAYMGAGHPAKALLCELLRQHNGRNNGHLHLSYGWLAKRGFNSRDVVKRASLELIERGLIIMTKEGGLNIGPHRFALTWLAITNFVGLDIQSKDYHHGAWSLMDKLPMPNKNEKSLPPHGKACTASRECAVPPHGKADTPTVPPHGSEKGILRALTVPGDGNNEYHQLPTTKTSCPIIGRGERVSQVPAKLTTMNGGKHGRS